MDIAFVIVFLAGVLAVMVITLVLVLSQRPGSRFAFRSPWVELESERDALQAPGRSRRRERP